ncbi:META domain-containing protein [Parabacteroides pacaensis]|uniref:META domain-containing protein n=1 Tax=Parabacteroides pacaensis TaxID=2086575 RepID=UPI000D107D7E|nr:META domain-containing protein [Parabacteroides pacaensis]
MKNILYLILPVVLVLLASCEGKKVDAKTLNGKWEIISVNGEKIKSVENQPYIEFDMSTKKVHGSGGCNIFNSTVTLSDTEASSIKIAPAAATMMACPEMDMESKIFKVLTEVTAVKSTDKPDEVALVNQAGEIVLLLSHSK